MSVRQLPDGRWVCEFRKGRDPDRRNSKCRFFGRGEAARTNTERFDLSLRDRRQSIISGAIGFSELADAYLGAKMASMSITDQDNTYRKLTGIIIPRLGELRAITLDHQKLDKYVLSRLQDTVKINIGEGKWKDTGRRVSKSTIHGELSIVRAILNWGVRLGLLSALPMANYEMPTRDDKRILPPTQEAFDAIVQHAAPHCRRLILISYYTGLRPGVQEAYSLTWDNVDLQRGTITIISAKKGGITLRVVPIHPTFHNHLTKWKEEDQKGGVVKYLINFHHRPIKTSMKTTWRTAKIKAGITRPLRPYSLRHKSISDILAAGGDVGSVAEIVGHADPQMTLKVYQETNTASKLTAIGGLGKK